MTDVNIGLLGYKFMGKAHSNAYRQVGRFFPGKFTPRLKVICGRDRSGAEAAARQFGWDEVETDWRKVVERKDIDVIDVSTPGELTGGHAVAATGSIADGGEVGAVGGIRLKTLAARAARVELFLVPEENYREAVANAGPMRVVGVRDLRSALDSLPRDS